MPARVPFSKNAFNWVARLHIGGSGARAGNRYGRRRKSCIAARPRAEWLGRTTTYRRPLPTRRATGRVAAGPRPVLPGLELASRDDGGIRRVRKGPSRTPGASAGGGRARTTPAAPTTSWRWLGPVPLSGPTERDIIDFLWQYVPRKISAEEEILDSIRIGVGRLLGYLTEQGMPVCVYSFRRILPVL